MNPQIDLGDFLERRIVPKTTKSSLADLVVLTCMDFRYPHRITDTLDHRQLRGKYDHLILAGASLGVTHKLEWQTTFTDQLKFAIDHHGVSQVLILDHRDCGAFREYLGVTPDDPAKERQAHYDQCKKAVDLIVQKFPKLAGNVDCLLLPVETVEDLGL